MKTELINKKLSSETDFISIVQEIDPSIPTSISIQFQILNTLLFEVKEVSIEQKKNDTLFKFIDQNNRQICSILKKH